MNGTLTAWVVVVAALACGTSLRAHHSISMFELGAPVWVKGTVTRYEPINPHAMFTLVERTVDGRVRRWTVEGPSLVRLGRLGAGDNFLNASDVVEVCGFPPKKEFVGPTTGDVKRYPSEGNVVHGHVLVMPDGRMRSWGSYGRLDNCIRPGDRAPSWVEFLNRDAGSRLMVHEHQRVHEGRIDRANGRGRRDRPRPDGSVQLAVRGWWAEAEAQVRRLSAGRYVRVREDSRKSTTRSNGSKPNAAATAGRRFEFALMS